MDRAPGAPESLGNGNLKWGRQSADHGLQIAEAGEYEGVKPIDDDRTLTQL